MCRRLPRPVPTRSKSGSASCDSAAPGMSIISPNKGNGSIFIHYDIVWHDVLGKTTPTPREARHRRRSDWPSVSELTGQHMQHLRAQLNAVHVAKAQARCIIALLSSALLADKTDSRTSACTAPQTTSRSVCEPARSRFHNGPSQWAMRRMVVPCIAAATPVSSHISNVSGTSSRCPRKTCRTKTPGTAHRQQQRSSRT